MSHFASITRSKFPKKNADDVIAQFKNDVVPTFKKMKQDGHIKSAIFVIDRDGGEAIGIAIYDSEQKLKNIEGKRGRDDKNNIDNPNAASTEFAKHRAKSIKDSGSAMEKSEWYEIVGEV